VERGREGGADTTVAETGSKAMTESYSPAPAKPSRSSPLESDRKMSESSARKSPCVCVCVCACVCVCVCVCACVHEGAGRGGIFAANRYSRAQRQEEQAETRDHALGGEPSHNHFLGIFVVGEAQRTARVIAHQSLPCAHVRQSA